MLLRRFLLGAGSSAHRHLSRVLLIALLVGFSSEGRAMNAVSPSNAMNKSGLPVIRVGGYYKKGPNWGAIGLGIGGAIILNEALKNQKSEQYPQKRQPREKKPQDVSEIECTGGSVKKGKCVCKDGITPRKLDEDQFTCEKLAADYAPDQVLTAFPLGSPTSSEDELAKEYNLEKVDSFDSDLAGSRLVLFRIKGGKSVEKVVASLQTDRRTIAPQPNYLYVQQTGPEAPKSTVASAPYVAQKLKLAEAHSISKGRNAVVALLDSNIDVLNRDLKAGIAGSYDATADKSSAIDPHSTALASIMIASGTVESIAPEAKLLSISVLRTNGNADSHSIGKGLEYAIAQRAQVILVPLSGRHDPIIERLIRRAAQTTLIIAPAGNNGALAAPAYPGAYPEVLAVTATDGNDRIYSSANQGAYVGVAAPGVDVPILQPNGKPSTNSGTSLACAQVAGLAALLIGGNPKLSVEEVRRAIVSSSIDLGVPGRDDVFGAGRIDAAAAIELVKPAPPAAAAPPPDATARAAAQEQPAVPVNAPTNAPAMAPMNRQGLAQDRLISRP